MPIPRRIKCRICEKKFNNEIKKSKIVMVTCPVCRSKMGSEKKSKKAKRRK